MQRRNTRARLEEFLEEKGQSEESTGDAEGAGHTGGKVKPRAKWQIVN